MTEVLDRDLVTAIEAQSPVRPQAAGPPGTTRQDSSSHSSDLPPQLRIDKVLVERFKEENFAGSAWRNYSSELVRYALPVIRSWLRSGHMFELSARIGRPVAKPGWFASNDALEIVNEVVAKGFTLFSAQLRSDAWNPDAGASLRTYMVWSCVRSFPNVFRQFERSHSAWSRHELTAEIDDCSPIFHDHVAQSAEETFLGVQAVHSALASLRAFDRQLILMYIEGMSHAEIAAVLETTPKAVERKLYRVRMTLRKQLDDKRRRWSASSAASNDERSSRYWKNESSDL